VKEGGLSVLSAIRWLTVALVLGAGDAAAAAPRPAPLQPFAPAQLGALGPMLLDRDLVVLELDTKGRLKQLATLTLVAAPPEVVREVVIHPERYAEFVRNMKRSRVVAEPGGTLWHEYAISYRVYTVEGRHRYVFMPKGSGDAVAPVEMYDPDGDGTRHYRWEFVPAGGATVLALYGFTEIAHDRFTSRYLDRAPTLESGFALIPQLTLLFSMKARAQQLSHDKVVLPAAAASVPWEFLLERGTVAILLSSGGRLREVNLVERSTAPAQSLVALAADPARWSSFVPTMKRSTFVGGADGAAVEIEQSLPLMSWTTKWAYRLERSSVDLVGLDGDLRGGHLRWDVRQQASGGSELILRAMADYQKGSVLLRQVYKLEPYLEYGFDVALSLLLLQSLKHRAEQRAGPP
jgi:hypothetical protein